MLHAVAKISPSAHGFVAGRNIRSNAVVHTNKRFVFRVDLENFFTAINFGRVRGLFIAAPYKLNPKVATVLAQICCFEGVLPQGAPTSPVISNMICLKLDRQLRRLARNNNCDYTRYADDLTFSTNDLHFPETIGVRHPRSVISLAGDRLSAVVGRNGFKINSKKVTLRRAMERQVVTGLITNKSTNVKRQLVRQIRAMLHASMKYGIEAAEREFHAKYYLKHRETDADKPSFKRVLQGKIAFLGMVKGKLDPVYVNFLYQLRELDPALVKTLPPKDWREGLMKAVYIMDCEKKGDIVQGTAFLLNDCGLVTCRHVLAEPGKPIGPISISVYQHETPHKKFIVDLVADDSDIDLALLRFTEGISGRQELLLGDDKLVRNDDEIILAGYPNYAPGHHGVVKRGRVVGRHVISGIERFLIDASIVHGNSGGPVLTKDRRVIGVAVTGVPLETKAHTTERHGVIPISALRHLKREG